MAHRIARDGNQDGEIRKISRNARRAQRCPLGIVDGFNPTRVRIPASAAGGITAYEVVAHMVATQRHRHPDDNAEAIARRFAEKKVATVDGPVSPQHLLFPGEDLWFYRMPAPEEPLGVAAEILYQDAQILVVNKPAGMATMPRGRHQTETALIRLRVETGIDELVPAHRLDRLTSGVLLFIADPAVRGAYQKLFSQPGAVLKTYEAVAAWDPHIVPRTRWSSFMEKKVGDLQARSLPTKPHNALTEVVDVQPLADGFARYVLRPHTGKTHQLRRHMCDAGVPILGDPLYPVVHDDEENAQLHLMSRSIAFVDPISGEQRFFEAPRRW